MKFNLYSLLIFSTLLLPCTAFADDCEQLDKNKDWKTGISQIQNMFESGDYDSVLQKGEELSYICPRSPFLNYYIGAAYKEKGDLENAAVYLEIAGDSTNEFATTADMLQKIFYARYEAEHADRSESAVEALKKENAALIAEREQNAKAVDEIKQSISTCQSTELENRANDALRKGFADLELALDYGVNMWAGIGTGIAGIIVTTVGGVLIAKSDKYSHTGYHEAYLTENEAAKYDRAAGTVIMQDYKINGGYIAGWTLLGVGITATMTGAILAGVYGYNITHFDSYAIGIAPNGISFGMTF